MPEWQNYRPDMATVLVIIVALALFFTMTMDMWLPHGW